jgi:hypothetical protein
MQVLFKFKKKRGGGGGDDICMHKCTQNNRKTHTLKCCNGKGSLGSVVTAVPLHAKCCMIEPQQRQLAMA